MGNRRVAIAFRCSAFGGVLNRFPARFSVAAAWGLGSRGGPFRALSLWPVSSSAALCAVRPARGRLGVAVMMRMPMTSNAALPRPRKFQSIRGLRVPTCVGGGATLAFLMGFVLFDRGLFAAGGHQGQVTFGGVPVPGAAVTATCGNATFVATTDPAGRYSFPDLPETACAIQVEMLGFAAMNGDVSISAWKLKMLPLNEIHASDAPIAFPALVPTAVARPNAQIGFQQLHAIASGDEASMQLTNDISTTSGKFANLGPDDLTQRSLDGSLVNSGTVHQGAFLPLRPSNGSAPAGVLAQPLYYAGISIFPGVSLLNARSFSLTGGDTPKPRYHNLDASSNLGGPLIPSKNNATFFIGYQRKQNANASIAAGHMPTVAERTGDLSQSVNPSGQPVRIVDPLTGQPFVGNLIPQSRISTQAVALFALFPLPNSGGNAPYNYQIPIVEMTHQDAWQARLSESFNTKNQLFGSFDMQGSRRSSPSLFSFLDTIHSLGINAAINWTIRSNRSFSATFRYQFSRLAMRTTPYFANRLNVSGLAGINGNNQDAVNWGPPTLIFSGGTSSLADLQYSFTRNQTNTSSYNSYWNIGRHNITFGGDVRRQQLNVLSQQDPRGVFTFAGAAGSDIAEFLLGVPDTSSIAFGNADKYFRQTVYDAFVTDDWKVNDALTVNAGVRWEYEAPVSELYGRIVNLHIMQAFSSVIPAVGNTFVRPDRAGVQPRIALAWRPLKGSALVVRAGYGVYRDTNVYQPIATQLAQQPPLSKSLSIQNTPSTPLTIANGFVTTPGVTLNTFAVDPAFRVGYAQNWIVSLQHDLPAALQLTVMYVGTKGTRLPQESLPNTFPSGAVSPAGYIYLTSNGDSTREASQIQLRRRMQSGLTVTAQYTYSKALDDAPLMAGGQAVANSTGGASIAQNWLDLGAERGLSNFDQRHQLTIQWQYSTGVGLRGGALLGGVKGGAFKGWTITSSLNIGSGSPETPIYFAAVPGTAVTGGLRPDVTGVSVYSAPAGLSLNPAAFRAPASGRWGDAGRNSIMGPSQFGLNASLGRSIQWGKVSMDLRVDVTNVLNCVTVKSWNATVNNAQFGLPSSVSAMRTVQPTFRVRF